MDWLADEPEQTIVQTPLKPWRVAIVDDDTQVHEITKLSLSDFEFEGRKIEFINAYSGEEAKKLFRENNDIAVVLLDVVMESDDAGLTVVKYIRDFLGNHYTRIILRTGQPGNVPKDRIIRDFDIDGYKSKTEITHDSLNHAFYVALRSYRDLNKILNFQHGLEAIIDSMSNLTQLEELVDFSQAIMNQLAYVLDAGTADFIIKDTSSFTLAKHKDKRLHISADGNDSALISYGSVPEDSNYLVLGEKALEIKTNISEHPYYVHYHCSKRNTETIFILKTPHPLSFHGEKLLHAFSMNVALALENLLFAKQITESLQNQKEELSK